MPPPSHYTVLPLPITNNNNTSIIITLVTPSICPHISINLLMKLSQKDVISQTLISPLNVVPTLVSPFPNVDFIQFLLSIYIVFFYTYYVIN